MLALEIPTDDVRHELSAQGGALITFDHIRRLGVQYSHLVAPWSIHDRITVSADRRRSCLHPWRDLGRSAGEILVRLKAGKQIRTELTIESHQKKAGTPTMGGILIVLPVVIIRWR